MVPFFELKKKIPVIETVRILFVNWRSHEHVH